MYNVTWLRLLTSTSWTPLRWSYHSHCTPFAISFVLFKSVYVIESYYCYYYMLLYSFEKLKWRGRKIAKCDY